MSRSTAIAIDRCKTSTLTTRFHESALRARIPSIPASTPRSIRTRCPTCRNGQGPRIEPDWIARRSDSISESGIVAGVRLKLTTEATPGWDMTVWRSLKVERQNTYPGNRFCCIALTRLVRRRRTVCQGTKVSRPAVFKPCCTERSSRKRTASATQGSERIVSAQ